MRDRVPVTRGSFTSIMLKLLRLILPTALSQTSHPAGGIRNTLRQVLNQLKSEDVIDMI